MLLLRGYRQTHIESFGGLVTLVERMDLPVGASPDCKNVEFVPGAVFSRFGTTKVLTGQATSKYVGMDSLVLPVGRRMVVGQQNGSLRYENPDGTFTAFSTTVFDPGQIHRIITTALYNRLHICGSQNGGLGNIEPRAWDGTNLDRFTYGAPGTAPTFVSGAAGTIPAGLRIGAVCFVMRSGYVTPPTWSATFTTVLNTVLNATYPIGPPACVARMLFVATVSLSGTFKANTLFHIPSVMLIPENTSTAKTGINFTEAQLLGAGASPEGVLSTFVGHDSLSDVIQVIMYSNRAIAIGEVPHIRSRDNAKAYTLAVAPESAQALNLRFDGGPIAGVNPPNGWAVQTAGGAFTTTAGAVNPTWAITSDGVTADLGRIRNGQSVGASVLEAAIALNEEVGVRVKMKVSAASAGGTIRVALRDSNAAPTFNLTVDINISSIGTGFYKFTGTLGTLTAYGTNLCVDVSMATPATTGVIVYIQGIEFYRTKELNTGIEGNPVAQASYPFDPESFDVQTGNISVGVGDGQNNRAVFMIGSSGSLYFAKERSLWVTSDNTTSEPSGWSVDQVSDTVGVYTPRAIGKGDGWVALLTRDGLYRFDGSTPVKVSNEIRPTWDSIKWTYQHLFWCLVDEQEQRVYCGVMTGADVGTLVLDTVLVLDYSAGWGDRQRRWVPWDGTPAATAACLSERANGTKKLLFGQSDGNVYQYDKTVYNDGDDVTAINAYYETAPIGGTFDVSNTGGVAVFASGAGTADITARLVDGTQVYFWQQELVATPARQLEYLTNLNAERLGVKIRTNVVGSRWSLKRLEVWQRARAWAARWGKNS